MNTEFIIRKLTSRKLWVAISEFISMLIIALGYAENTATQVAALIMAGAGAIAYIVGEGLADAAHTGSTAIPEPAPDPEPVTDTVIEGFCA